MTFQTNRLKIGCVVATIGVNVMDFEVVHITLLTLGLVSTDCTGVFVAPECDLAIVEERQAVLAFVLAGCLTDFGVVDDFEVGVDLGGPLVTLNHIAK